MSATRPSGSAPWTPEDVWRGAILLHERVHDVESQNLDWECPTATETEAQALRCDWLEEQGAAHRFDWLAIRFWSRCGNGPRP